MNHFLLTYQYVFEVQSFEQYPEHLVKKILGIHIGFHLVLMVRLQVSLNRILNGLRN